MIILNGYQWHQKLKKKKRKMKKTKTTSSRGLPVAAYKKAPRQRSDATQINCGIVRVRRDVADEDEISQWTRHSPLDEDYRATDENSGG